MSAVPVLIAGGGPVGLVLALELEHRGIDAVLVERNPRTTQHPKMDVTNGRSMEHFRRLGIADEIRSHGVPSDHPMTVVWCTRAAEWELARFDYPSVDWGRDIIRYVDDGTLPLEPDLRISQVVLEPVLKGILETRAKHVQVRFGWELESFAQDEDGVTAVIRSSETGASETIRSDYLAGCDGAGSVAREGLGIGLEDLDDERRRNYMIHFRSPDRAFFQRFGTSWHIQAPLAGTIISQNDEDTWTIHIPLPGEVDAEAFDPRAFLFEMLGREIECEILVANPWFPRLCVAERYGEGRVWLAGDSVHQVIPTGGYGMNTGVGDAVDLGWKLAARIEGWGGEALLPSYERERLPVGIRNRAASARHLGVRMEIAVAALSAPAYDEDSEAGARAREALGTRILELGNLENEALGIEIGYRYEGSPIVCSESGSAPPESMERYVPTTWPGARLPSVHLADGSALFDALGKGFTLLRFADVDAGGLIDAARERGVPLEVVDVRDAKAHRLCERALVLVRPDQHVAWRGDEVPAEVLDIVDRVRGAAPGPA